MGKLRLDRTDWGVVIVVLVLLALMGLTIAHGDQIGIRVRDYEPQNTASSRPTIRITFDDPIASKSLDGHFAMTPPVDGQLTVNANEVVFRPTKGLQPGTAYTVIVQAGIAANTGRLLTQNLQWHFQVSPPRVIDVGPVTSIIQNLYLLNNDPSADPQPLTKEQYGVGTFAIAPDGSSVLYTGIEKGGGASLHLLDTTSFTASLLYECQNAVCSNPVWRPDGGAIAFEQADLNMTTHHGTSAPRIWIYDMNAKTAQPLYADTTRNTVSPRWSPDGSTLISFDPNTNTMIIHNIAANTDQSASMDQGSGVIGDFSPDGKSIIFPKLVQPTPDKYVTHWTLVDLTSKSYTERNIELDADTGDDLEAVWQTDGKSLLVLRRTPDSSDPSGTGQTPAQVYQLDLATGKTQALTNDLTYRYSAIALSPDGMVLAAQRTPINPPGAHPEVWTYNLATKELRQVAKTGTLPHWIP